MSQLLKVYPALENRSYRLFFFGQVISFVGTWLQNIALIWLVSRMTHNAFLVGLTTALSTAPIIFLAPIGGAIVDRFDTTKLLTWTTRIGLLQATLLGVLYMSGHLSLYAIYALSLAWGIVGGLDSPVRHAGIVKMVDRELVASAKALNGLTTNLGFIFGPIFGGLLIASFGIGITFFANAISFVPLMLIIPFLRFKTTAPANQDAAPFKPFAMALEGMRYVFGHHTIGSLLTIMGFATIFGFSFRAILPVVAREVLEVGPRGYGWLSMAPGLGALMGGVIVSRLSKKLPVAILIFFSTIILGVSLVAFANVHSLGFAMAILVVVGLSFENIFLTAQSTAAVLSEPHMIGRVVGCGASIFFAGVTIGSAAIGYFAEHFNPPVAIQLNGLALLGLAIVLFFKRESYAMALARS